MQALKGKWHVMMAVVAVIIALLGVIVLSGKMTGGETQRVDEYVLIALRPNPAEALISGQLLLRQAAMDVTAMGSYAFLGGMTLFVCGFCLIVRRLDIVAFSLVSFVGATGLNLLLKDIFARERPSVVEHLVNVSSYSYPSGHALMSAAVYLSLAAILAERVGGRWSRIYIICTALLITLLVGISRIYLGVHYPSDVIAGWAVGLSWGLLCWLATAMIAARKVRKPPSSHASHV